MCGTIVAKLAAVVMSPSPEIAGNINGKRVSKTSGNRLEFEAIYWIAGECGEVNGDAGVDAGIITELTRAITSPCPKIAGGVNGEGVVISSSDSDKCLTRNEISTGDGDGLATDGGAGVGSDAGDGGSWEEVGVVIS